MKWRWAVLASFACCHCAEAPVEHPKPPMPQAAAPEPQPSALTDAGAEVAADETPDASGSVGTPGYSDDHDQDGIVDAHDECPERPEVVNGTDDDDGCPDEGTPSVKLHEDRIELLKRVEFRTDHRALDRKSFPLLDEVSALLRMHRKLRIRVEGHYGDPVPRGLTLGMARAQTVVKYLVAKGIAYDRFESRGMGIAAPLVPGDTPEARRTNERIELWIIR